MPRHPFPGLHLRKHPATIRPGPDAPDLPPLIRLWMLRILVTMNAHRQFIDEHGFSNDAVASALGLGHWIDPDDREFQPKEVRKELRQLHARAERELRGALAPAHVRANIARLEPLAGLSEVDARVLEFAVLIRSERLLEDTADWLGYLSSQKVIDVLAILLGIAPQEVRSSLGANGGLARSGLVSLSRDGYSTLHGKLELISDEFADLIHIQAYEGAPRAQAQTRLPHQHRRHLRDPRLGRCGARQVLSPREEGHQPAAGCRRARVVQGEERPVSVEDQ
jgi:hypothetical protein